MMNRLFSKAVTTTGSRRNVASGVADMFRAMHPPGYFESVPEYQKWSLLAVLSSPLAYACYMDYKDSKEDKVEKTSEERPGNKLG